MRNIAYLIRTVVSIYLCIMYDGAAPFYLLGFLILLALVLYGSSWYLRAHLRVHLNVQIPVVEKGQEFPVLKSPCPIDGTTKRAYAKDLVAQLQREHPGTKERLFHAITEGKIEDWDLPGV